MDKNRHQRYFLLLKWLVKDILRSQWKLGLFSAICSFLSQVFQTTTLAFALYYSGLIATHTPFELFGKQYDTHTSKELLYGVAFSVMVLFGVGVLFQYLSRSAGLNVRKGYTAHCTTELIQRAADGNFGVLTAEGITSLTKIAKGNTMYCGRVANLLVLAVPESVVTVVSLACLVYLEPTLTLLLSIVFMLAGVFIYRTNIRAAKESMLSDRYNPRARKAIREKLQNLDSSIPGDARIENDDWTRWLNSFIRKVRAVEEGGLVVGLTTAVLLALLLGGLVLDMMNDASDWGRIVVYLVLFRVTTTQLQKLVRRMVSINRFYPQVRGYWKIITTNKICGTGNEDASIIEDEDED